MWFEFTAVQLLSTKYGMGCDALRLRVKADMVLFAGNTV